MKKNHTDQMIKEGIVIALKATVCIFAAFGFEDFIRYLAGA